MKKYLLFLLICPLIFLAQTETIVFNYIGNYEQFVVPSGVTSIDVKIWGAGGGGSSYNNSGSSGSSGGSGGFVKATIPVTSGSILNIQVGGGGTYNNDIHDGGFAGGGQAGVRAGSGGGYSAIFRGTTISTGNILAIAGGGGGGGRLSSITNGGAGGGTNAGDGTGNRLGGRGTTNATGGAAGTNNGTNNNNGASAGSALQGGKGSTTYAIWGSITGTYEYGGGGGGGGRAGGGGGYGTNNNNDRSTGGGGGSSFVANNVTNITLVNGNSATDGTTSQAPMVNEIGYLSGIGVGGGRIANGGNGLVIITFTRQQCSGTPNGGNAVITPSSGLPLSNFVATVTGGTVGALGLTYQWQMSSSVNGPWNDIAGAIGETANLIAENLAPGEIRYYRRATTCTNSNLTRYSTVASFTIASPNNCSPTYSFAANNNDYYIQDVSLLGTLNDVYNLNTGYSNNPKGYQDFTGISNRAIQEDGAGVNISVRSNRESYMIAWVDWNQNGTFEQNEVVYNSGSIYTQYVVFGFTIPTGQNSGYYRLRIRSGNNAFNSSSACSSSTYGETEDYLFQVIKSCPNRILSYTSSQTCGANRTTFNFTATNGATQIKIYDAIDALIPIQIINIASDGTFSWYSPAILQDKEYFVSANNSSCESRERIKIKAYFKKSPEITFTNTKSEFCGDISGNEFIKFGAGGDRETQNLLYENFDSGLGAFTVAMTGQNNNLANWTHRTGIYVPGTGYQVIKPAIASGLQGDGFVIMNADIGSGSNRINTLTTNASFNTQDFIDLTLSYKVFTFFEGIVNDNGYLFVQVSTNNGGSWQTIKEYRTNVGIPNKWLEESINLEAYRNVQNLKIRFLGSSYAEGSRWSADIMGVDAVRLFGDRSFSPNFTWSSSNANDYVLYNDDCATLYDGSTSEICVKPNATNFDSREFWKITVKATLKDGCEVTASIDIINSNRRYASNTIEANNIWSNRFIWKPSVVPTETKCVFIPDQINNNRTLKVDSPDAIAKTIQIANSGSIYITEGNALKIVDKINNLGDGTNFTVENDGNLLQVNHVSNTGNITVKRNTLMKRLDYTYWGSPVEGQNLRAFSPGKLYTYNEWDDYFTLLNGTDNFDSKAKGYAIQAGPTHQSGVSTAFNGVFLGKPKNGTISMPLERVGRGYNLIGNPYPSNIDFTELYKANSDLIYNTAYFWTNLNHNPESQGSNYPNGRTINNYAILNGTGGVPATNSKVPSTVTNSSQIPNEFIKVGQGFIVRKKAAGTGTLIFNNAMRSNDNTGHFFRKKPRDRYWLELKTPLNIYTTLLVGYIDNATNDFEIDYDATLMAVGSDAFYSVLGTRKLGIQGKASFVNTDVVALGTSHHENGEYTISAPTREGIFASSQSIYLRDKQTGITTDLTKGDYTFTANKGLSEGRFEIVYQPDATLDVVDSEVSSEEVQIYRDGDHFVAKSKTSKIMKVQLFNMSGQYLISVSPELKEYKWSHQLLNNGVYVVNIQLENGATLTRKIRK